MTQHSAVLTTGYDTVYYPSRECIVTGEREATLDQDTRRLAAIHRAQKAATSEWAIRFWQQTEQRLLREFRWKGLASLVQGVSR